jgi:hypothetical protein
MMTRLCVVAFVVAISTLACYRSVGGLGGGAAKGETCDDENVIGGDCTGGLLCAREKPSEPLSRLVCLTPCADPSACAQNEVCTGDRGTTQMACRPR